VTWQFVLTGFVIGTLVGLTGMGGGSIRGVLLGRQWSIRVPDAMLRRALATVLLLSGLKLVVPEEAAAGIAVAVGVGLAALFVYGLMSRRAPGKRLPATGTTTPMTFHPDA
jgi:uncharacterized membrane protein YeiH